MNPNEETAFNWQKQFSTILNNIKNFTHIMGTKFSTIGASLSGIHTESNNVAKIASEIVQTLTGNIQKKVLSNIKHLADQKKILLEAFTNNEEYISNALDNFLQDFYKVDDSLEKFESISSLLNTFRMNIRIANAKICTKKTGISSLTDEIKNLTTEICENSEMIKQELSSIKTQINNSIVNKESQKHLLAKNLHYIFADLFQNTDSFCEFNEEFVKTTHTIADESDEIVQAIYSIVISIQFDDIIRQKVEHITKSVNDMLSMQYKEQPTQQQLGEISELCQLQIMQLDTIKEELNTSTSSIKTGLEGVEYLIRKMIHHTSNTKDKNGKNAITYLTGINESISKISDGFTEVAQRDEILSDTASNIALKAGNINKFIKNVKKIGTVIKIVSLNSQFKVKNFSEDGRRLTELSKAILELSGKTIQNTKELSNTINNIANRSNEMKHYTLNIIKKDIDKANAIIKRLHKVIAKLNMLHNELLSKLNLINRLGHRLIEEIRQKKLDISHIREKKADVEEIRALFKATMSECHRLSPETRKMVELNVLKNTRNRYTMQAERDIFDKHFGLQAESVAHSANSGEKLADNVELF